MPSLRPYRVPFLQGTVLESPRPAHHPAIPAQFLIILSPTDKYAQQLCEEFILINGNSMRLQPGGKPFSIIPQFYLRQRQPHRLHSNSFPLAYTTSTPKRTSTFSPSTLHLWLFVTLSLQSWPSLLTVAWSWSSGTAKQVARSWRYTACAGNHLPTREAMAIALTNDWKRGQEARLLSTQGSYA